MRYGCVTICFDSVVKCIYCTCCACFSSLYHFYWIFAVLLLYIIVSGSFLHYCLLSLDFTFLLITTVLLVLYAVFCEVKSLRVTVICV